MGDAPVLDIWSPLARPQKAVVRNHIFWGVGRAKRALFLPAAYCHDVQEGLRCGVLDQDSSVIAVEREPEIAATMFKTLQGMGFIQAPHIHANWLHLLELNDPIDFAYIDLLGTLTYETAEWISAVLSPRLKPESTVAFTLSHAIRANRFIPLAFDVLRERYDELCVGLADELDFYDYGVVYLIAILKIIFRDWKFRIKFRVRHADSHVLMYTYRLYDFRPTQHSVWPRFSNFITPNDLTNCLYRRSRIERASEKASRIASNNLIAQRKSFVNFVRDQYHLDLVLDQHVWCVVVPETGVTIARYSGFRQVESVFRKGVIA